MEFNLLKNGVDSLKAAQFNINDFYENHDDGDYFIKDAIIFLNHANEILLKYLLKNKDEALLFKDNKKYRAAKEKMDKEKLESVYEADGDLETVNLTFALKRVSSNCAVKMGGNFDNSIIYLYKKRNELMHYELLLTLEEMVELVGKLEHCYQEAYSFYYEHIPSFVKTFNESRYMTYSEEYLQRKQDELMDQIADAALESQRDAYYEQLEDQARALESYAIKSGR
ncbi:hypothetical protein AZE41_12080 [Sporosarcina psychrophila]|nr:hypothetical protein AZE41_12080 [Sporosarcina psychrophila]